MSVLCDGWIAKRRMQNVMCVLRLLLSYMNISIASLHLRTRSIRAAAARLKDYVRMRTSVFEDVIAPPSITS